MRPLGWLGLLVAGLVTIGVGGGFVTTGATFSDATASDGALTVGTWSKTRYLLHDPSPAVADTRALIDLPVAVAPPTATVLYDLSTECDSSPGRRITRGTGLATETDVCRYATWRLGVVTEPTTISGNVVVSLWARKSNPSGSPPVLRAFLRDWDGTAHAEIASATATVASDAFVAVTLTIPVSTTLAVGHSLELKLVATSPNRNVVVAYDVAAYPSSITLP